MKRIGVSVVTTVYKSERYLPDFLKQVITVLEEVSPADFELLFVIDGLTDNSKGFLLAQKEVLPQIRIIELSRNFGHHYAISAGLQYATGELIFLIDCDLEVSPAVLKDFKAILDQGAADVVFGVQVQRKGAFLERTLGGAFWRLFNYLSDTKIPEDTVTERLMKRSYVDALLSMGDRNLFFAGMMHWVGFEQIPCRVNKGQREGQSTYTFRKRMDLLIEAVTSFSEKPLKLLFRVGLIIFVVSVVLAALFLFKKFFYPETVLVGFTSIIVLMLFGIGSILSALGLVGLYISRVFNQVKNRPLYLVKNIY